jgi:hypothetical protein
MHFLNERMEHYECQISNKLNVWQGFQPLPAYVFLVCDILRCARP